MRVVIRVDSSNLIGSGHLMRCLTLAGQFKKQGHEVHFICRDLDGNLSGLVNEKGFNLTLLPRAEDNGNLEGYAKWLTVTQEQDAEATINVLSGFEHISRVVVDSYAIDETWEKMVRPYTDEIFVIDDLANRRHDCDVLLDQNYYLYKEHRYDGLVPEACKLLLGPEYALLREEFYEAKKHLCKRDGNIRNILVFYGGSDLTDETTKAVCALIDLKLSEVTVNVIVGASNQRKEKIHKLCTRYDFLHYYEQVSNMAELMSHADVFICAGGTTLLEAMYLQLPAIVTAVAENQREAAEYGASLGLIEYLGFYDQVSNLDIAQALQRLTLKKRSEIADKCEEILGMHRIEC